jgi:3-deoxy-7-phosphoheptulonate synthase
MIQTNDLRIDSVTPLISPAELKAEVPMPERANRVVVESRQAIIDILEGRDRRLLAIVGPCSIHDPVAAIEYAGRLAELRQRLEERLFIVMRVYFEKPRTTVGWKGFVVDPDLDGSYDIAKGLRLARRLLVEISEMGVPAGSEMLDPIVPQYTSDLVVWSSIGARTTESQTHREMASGLSMPVGFKNGTDGRLETAVNALSSARHPHSFIGIDQGGRTCVLKTRGNQHGHVILRGGKGGPNYDQRYLDEAAALLRSKGVEPALVVDCSHDNSGKQHAKQEPVLKSVMAQRSTAAGFPVGIMIESNLFEGNQKIPADKSPLRYGVSITDACVGWEQTVRMLEYAHASL